IRKLVFRNLIKEVGRSELPGRPILYGVTEQFLDYFGLKTTADLPEVEIIDDNDETDLFDSKYQENIEN
ncbi:MAG: SMC-Scp complex subunit ScpB, partial [Bacilli bacterium]|nr:SMC-Scp complex subunit ScpB [Bacilli bacterium]